MPAKKALKTNEFTWIAPETIQRQRLDEAETVEDLKALMDKPSQGEFREITGSERDENGAVGPVYGRLVQRVVDGEDVTYVAYDGDADDYTNTVEKT